MTQGVKIHGRDVYVDGRKVAQIRGFRSPSGHHTPYQVFCTNGEIFGTFAYAQDARRFCRENGGSHLIAPACTVEAHEARMANIKSV